MAADFFSLVTESEHLRQYPGSSGLIRHPRSCNDQDELVFLISHLMEASNTSAVGNQILARASVRLLFSRCRESCGLLPLDEAKGSQWWHLQPTMLDQLGRIGSIVREDQH